MLAIYLYISGEVRGTAQEGRLRWSGLATSPFFFGSKASGGRSQFFWDVPSDSTIFEVLAEVIRPCIPGGPVFFLVGSKASGGTSQFSGDVPSDSTICEVLAGFITPCIPGGRPVSSNVFSEILVFEA